MSVATYIRQSRSIMKILPLGSNPVIQDKHVVHVPELYCSRWHTVRVLKEDIDHCVLSSGYDFYSLLYIYQKTQSLIVRT
jgi:hypothetical protein